jgi:hypothetical protein
MTYLDQDLAGAVIETRVLAARERRLAHQAKKERRAARRFARRQRPSLWARCVAHRAHHVAQATTATPTTAPTSETSANTATRTTAAEAAPGATSRLHGELVA